jgi:hypothetical protein
MSRKHGQGERLLGTALMVLLVAGSALLAPSDAEEQQPARAAAIQFFEQQVQPILTANCLKCHGGKGTAKGGLRLTSRQGLLKGGETGPAIDVERLSDSLILKAIHYESYEMPPTGKLPDDQIAILERWVKMGAPGLPGVEVVESEAHSPPPVNDQTKQFWSFQPVQRPAVPVVTLSDWVRSPIDAFILHRLEKAGLRPAPPAAKQTLIRRAYYDLTGLPPSPDEVAEFIADTSVDAYERLIDRLLDSSHYGERWARHWLDLVRYAETNSYERDGDKPFVWRYRDYVIRSLNNDKPYDQFILEQLAGDELDSVTPESIIATGYYRLGIWQDEPVDPEQELFEDLDDFVRTTGEVFLGLSIGCARCHDHKLDPLPQKDYYRFLAFFRNIRRFGVRSNDTVLDASVQPIGSPEEVKRYRTLAAAYRARLQKNRATLQKTESGLRKDLRGVENDEWKTEAARIDIARTRIGGLLTQKEFDQYVLECRERDELRSVKPPGMDQALCVKEHGSTAPATYVLVRGNAHAKGDEVQPGFPAVLSPPNPQIVVPPGGQSSGRRTALARWIVSPDNPLTGRVMVNRLWQYHFGRGIVRSSSDFGFQGMAPTHPELLDWLASEFVSNGWRLKPLHKQIMLSNTYCMSSLGDPEALAQDPVNDLFWSFDMRRLSAEAIRDSVLAVNNSLNRQKMYGPSIFMKIPAEVLAGQSRPGDGWGESTLEDRTRRSIYIKVKRSLIVPMLANFDGPESDFSCPVRFQTTQPTQALGMLNSAFMNEQAQVFANNLRNAFEQPPDQVRTALGRVMQRAPSQAEIQRGLKLLGLLEQQHGLDADQALKQFCLICLNLNEFIYVD